ncbi:MAG: CBS domain-containing protein [Candidatus Krumholzibacteria bacterium]|nr:CBS domain-containing protein [Candidatus Krumholzibacteria bacterium]
MTTVRQLLEKKRNDVWSVAPETSVYDAIALMADKSVGALLVMEGSELVGIVSERDYARKVILKGRSSKQTPVRDIMTTKVLYVTPTHSLEECMAIMTEKRIRHLPVLEEGRLLGVFSSGDVIKATISEQEFMIEQLENYIKGR